MTLQEIKNAVNAGKTVHWASDAYTVVKGKGPAKDRWFVVCSINGSAVGLTWADGVTLNDAPFMFYVADEMEPPTEEQMNGEERMRDYQERKARAS
jgi:hypothetical protein